MNTTLKLSSRLLIDIVKNCKSRGLRRLERIAREEGLITGKSSPEIQNTETDPEEHDE